MIDEYLKRRVFVPRDYQRVINPWMTQSEIRRSVRFIDQLLKKLPADERRELLMLDRPPHNFSRNR